MSALRVPVPGREVYAPAGCVRVVRGDERATVYPEGGIGFEERLPGFRSAGWFVCDEPSEGIERLALAVRAEAFPHLPPLPGQPVLVRAVVG